jgi:hypothetical protein
MAEEMPEVLRGSRSCRIMESEVDRSKAIMNRKRALAALVAAVAVVSFGLPSSAWAYDQREVLRGLTGVKVVIETIDPSVERLGFTRNQLQSNVEAQIRKVGIKILKAYKPPAMTALYVNVHTLIPSQAKSIVVYSINVMVYENVYLKRDIGTVGDLKEVRAADWVKATVGLLGVTRVSDLYKKVELQVDKFISDYLAMNQ